MEKNVICDIMTIYIILHNMIIKYEREFNKPIEFGRKTLPPDIEIAKKNENV